MSPLSLLLAGMSDQFWLVLNDHVDNTVARRLIICRLVHIYCRFFLLAFVFCFFFFPRHCFRDRCVALTKYYLQANYKGPDPPCWQRKLAVHERDQFRIWEIWTDDLVDRLTTYGMFSEFQCFFLNVFCHMDLFLVDSCVMLSTPSRQCSVHDDKLSTVLSIP